MVKLVFAAGLSENKSEARRLIEQGGIYLDNRRMSPEHEVELREGMLLRRGQRRSAHIVRLHQPK